MNTVSMPLWDFWKLMVWMQKVLDFLVSVWIHIFLFSWESRFRCIGSVLGIPRRDDWYNKIWKKEKKNLQLWQCIIHIVITGKSWPRRYENLDALFMASASSPIRAIHRSINSLFSCLSFRDCASAILS